jgi:hypothetical protein
LTALAASAGAVVLAVAAVVVPLAAAGSDAVQRPTRGPGPVGDVPQLAQERWPRVRRIVAEQCPAMEPAWLGALVEVESGWDPRAVNPDTAAARLVQARRSAWMAVADGARARGWPQAGSPPADDWPGWDPLTHLEVMVPWMCANLAHAADVIERRGLELDAHAGAAVCHIAGCRRLRESTTGVPAAGEAGWDAVRRRCATIWPASRRCVGAIGRSARRRPRRRGRRRPRRRRAGRAVSWPIPPARVFV